LLKLLIQFPRHLTSHCCIHITLATQGIGNHVSFSWMVVYLQVIVLDEL
jgi:hypothetical protein